MIVSCHILQYSNNELAWWLNVGVYSFIAISGFLYGEKEISDSTTFLAKRIKKILIPYWLYLPFAFTLIWIVTGSLNIKQSIGMLLLTNTVNGLDHLWYIAYIMICYMITPYLCDFKKHVNKKTDIQKIMIWFVLCTILQTICFIGFPGFKMSVINTYIISFALSGIVFQKKFVVICLALVLNVLKIVYENQHILFPGFHYFSDYCHMALGIAILTICLVVFRNVKYNSFLSFSDKQSYSIYICHHIFILGPLSLMQLTQDIPLNITVILIITLASAILLTKFSNWIINQL